MPACDALTVELSAHVAARHVIPGDVIEVPDGNDCSVRKEVLDVVFGVVWVAGERMETVLLVTDPVNGWGHAFESDNPVCVVYDMPDYPSDYTHGPTAPIEPGDVPLW